MRSFFVKIFLSFWLAMSLILVGVIALAAFAASERARAIDGIDSAELAQSATTALQDDGARGLKKWAEQARDSVPGVPIYLLDETGKDILGRVPSERELHRWQRWNNLHDERRGLPAPGSGEHVRPPIDDPAVMAYFRDRGRRAMPEVVGANGEKYTLLVSVGDASLVNVFGTKTVIIALFGLTMGVSGLICWWLALSFSAPIARLQTSARALAAGDLDARVGDEVARRHDELGVLGREFNDMAAQLRSMITAKQTLLRDMSHELRSPLARLQVALTLARRAGPNLDLQLDRIERDSERLDHLIGQILQLSRLTTAEPSILRDTLDLTDLITEIVEDASLEGLPQNKRVDWTPTQHMTIVGDKELIRRAVENVVRNAVRVTPPQAALDISLNREGGDAILVVRDHGPGVPEPEIDRIFEPFYRVADPRNPDRSSGGLGLTIAAKVMALHNGFVRARNAVPSGLIVEMGFPLKVATADSTGRPAPAAIDREWTPPDQLLR